MCPTRFTSSASFYIPDDDDFDPFIVSFCSQREKERFDKSPASPSSVQSRPQLLDYQISEDNLYNSDPDNPSNSSSDSGFSSDDSRSFLAWNNPKALNAAIRRHRAKKSVRFADSLGLELEKTKFFFRDEVLVLSNSKCSASLSMFAIPEISYRLLPTNFVYRSESESMERIRRKRVAVVSFNTTSAGHLIGQVNVLDSAFDKEVIVRYTVDGWKTQRELVASFSHKLSRSDDIDSFCFVLALSQQDVARCELCVSLSISDVTFWDNNEGQNYCLEWIAA